MDVSDEDCQKQMIKIFVNSVFVYDDKVVLTFNYSGVNRTITLQEIDAGLQQGVRLPRGAAYHSVGKRRIACDEFFRFITKLIAHSLCCSSLPNRSPA